MKIPLRTATWSALASILLLAWFVYRPGLTGSFHFDDFSNLPILGTMGPIDNAPAFWRYITAGQADPTGRPVALLSFLIDARDWPAEPYPFLRTSILIHLANGLLLAALLRHLGQAILPERLGGSDATIKARMQMAAIVGAGLWMLHPLLVSTTLYVVQREALLSTTFTLLGLLLWLSGRQRFAAGFPRSGLALTAAGLIGCTLLGTLSKANGVLLPLLALVIEAVLLRKRATFTNAGSYSSAMRLLAAFPALIVAAYLLYAGLKGVTQGIDDIRPWSLGERLLTQPRMLVDYLQLLWLPRPFSSGIFNDQVVASTSLIEPTSTLTSILIIFGTLTGALIARNRFPLLAVAILFYFTGHLLESTTIALELHFEHRNYLPSLLLFWPLATWLCGFRPNSTDPYPHSHMLLKALLACALLAGLAVMTHARASLWGDPQSQALLWAELNPKSPRAQAYAASVEVSAGRPDLATARLKRALIFSPYEVQLSFGLLTAQCANGHLEEDTLQTTAMALANTRNPGGLLTSWFTRAIESSSQPACPQLSLDAIERLILAAESNPHLQKRRGSMQDLEHLKGRIQLARGNSAAALVRFNDALDEQVRISFALQQAALLGAAGQPHLALDHLRHYETMAEREFIPEAGMPRVHTEIVRRQGYWTGELHVLKRTLEADRAAITSTSDGDGN